MYARGLSTRDIAAAFRDEGGNSLLSKSAVSELTKRLWTEYEAFATRELSEDELLNCYFDGIAERLRPGLPHEAVLCAWGIVASGKRYCWDSRQAPSKRPRAPARSSRICAGADCRTCCAP